MQINLLKNKINNKINLKKQENKQDLTQKTQDRPGVKSIYDISFGKNIIGLSNRALNFDMAKYKKTGVQDVKYSSGGLVTAMNSAGLDTWVAWDGLDKVSNQQSKIKTTNGTEIKHLKLDSNKFNKFYGTISNGVLWPAFHMTEDRFEKNDVYGKFLIKPEKQEDFDNAWSSYQNINKKFANAALKSLDKKDDDNILWVQDYQLLLAPKYIRKGLDKQPDINAKVGYFHHIPFPTANVLTNILGEDKSKEVVNSLLQSDLIGFHVPSYVNNFMNTVEKLDLPEVKNIDKENNLITYEKNGKTREIKVKDFAISIDYQKENESAKAPEVKEAMKELQEEFLDNNKNHKYMVFNIERADFTKNLVDRVKSIGQFLDTTSPRVHDKFSFIIAAPPSRLDVKSYADNYKSIKKQIGRINNQYEESEGYSPIIFRENGVNGAEKLAMFRLADSLVINPISDGMNLVGKELAAYKQEGDNPYKLVMSKTPGIAQDPAFRDNSVIIKDVLSIDDTVSAMKEAFDEIRKDSEKLKGENAIIQQSVKNNDVKKWSENYMDELKNWGN